MSNIPALMGAPGRAATFTGDNGMGRQGGEEMGRAKAFANEGSKEGGPAAMPSEDRAGAFECDESCSSYSGDPRNAGGPNGRPAAPNKFPGQ